MKKTSIVVTTVILSVVALAMIGVLIYFLVGGNTVNIFNFDTETKLIKQEEFRDTLTSLDVDVHSQSVEYYLTDNDFAKIEQYGDEKDEMFTSNLVGSSLVVKIEDKNIINFFNFDFGQEKLVVYLPKSWLIDSKCNARSGSVRVFDPVVWKNTYFNVSSGSIAFESDVTCNDLSVLSSSGSVRLSRDVTADAVFLKSTSGSVRAEGNIKSSDILTALSTSGSVRLHNIEAKSCDLSSTSGSVNADSIVVEDYDIRCSSGSIRIGEISGGGRMKSTSGSVTATLISPVGDVSASSSSGSVRLTVPSSTEFTFQGHSSSGSVKTDFDLTNMNKSDHDLSGQVGSNPTCTINASCTSGSVHVYKG